jgi:hypothetical protein
MQSIAFLRTIEVGSIASYVSSPSHWEARTAIQSGRKAFGVRIKFIHAGIAKLLLLLISFGARPSLKAC